MPMQQTIAQALNDVEKEVLTAPLQALSLNSSASNLCQRFADIQALVEYYVSDEQTSLCRSEEGRVKCILGDAPTLEEIGLAYGPEMAQALLVILFADIFKKSFPDEVISEASLEDFVKDVYADCSWMKVSDFNLFFYFVRRGEFGDRYGAHVTFYLSICLNKFRRKRNEIIAEYEEEEKRKEREESRKGSVSFEQFCEMNPEMAQRTEAFDANHKAPYYGPQKKEGG